MKKTKLFQILMILSLLINILLISFYFLKLNPEIKQLKETLIVAEKKNTSTNCTKAYSASQGKFVDICKSKSETLSDCSKNFSDRLDKKTLSALVKLKTVSEIDKFRDLAIKICMQNAGFDY
jgi:hypothetical protein